MFFQHLDNCPEFLAGDHTLLREILHPQQHPVALPYSIAQARLLPDTASLPHRLSGSEVYYILQGSGTLHINDQIAPLRPGTIACVPPFALQYVRNTGASDLVFLCIVHPAWTPQSEHLAHPPQG